MVVALEPTIDREGGAAVRRCQAIDRIEGILHEIGRPVVRGSPWVDLIPSTVLVNYRLLKLKVEMLNLLSIIPSQRMGWKGFEGDLLLEEYPIGSIVLTPYGRGEVKDIRSDGMLVIEPTHWVLANGSIPRFYMHKRPPMHTPKVIYDDFDPNAGLRPHDLNRDAFMHEKSLKFVRRVQVASTELELLDCLMELEEVLPPEALVMYNKEILPGTVSGGGGEVAMRLFSLDRAIRYETVELNLKGEKLGFKPRTAFVPKCPISVLCTKNMCHSGKCEYIRTGKESIRHEYSRVSDEIDTVSSMQLTHTTNDETGKEIYIYRQPLKIAPTKEPKGKKVGYRRQRAAYSDDEDDFNEELNSEDEEDNEKQQEAMLMRKYIDKKTGIVNLDLIFPYIPAEVEVLERVWI